MACGPLVDLVFNFGLLIDSLGSLTVVDGRRLLNSQSPFQPCTIDECFEWLELFGDLIMVHLVTEGVLRALPRAPAKHVQIEVNILLSNRFGACVFSAESAYLQLDIPESLKVPLPEGCTKEQAKRFYADPFEARLAAKYLEDPDAVKTYLFKLSHLVCKKLDERFHGNWDQMRNIDLIGAEANPSRLHPDALVRNAAYILEVEKAFLGPQSPVISQANLGKRRACRHDGRCANCVYFPGVPCFTLCNEVQKVGSSGRIFSEIEGSLLAIKGKNVYDTDVAVKRKPWKDLLHSRAIDRGTSPKTAWQFDRDVESGMALLKSTVPFLRLRRDLPVGVASEIRKSLTMEALWADICVSYRLPDYCVPRMPRPPFGSAFDWKVHSEMLDTSSLIYAGFGKAFRLNPDNTKAFLKSLVTDVLLDQLTDTVRCRLPLVKARIKAMEDRDRKAKADGQLRAQQAKEARQEALRLRQKNKLQKSVSSKGEFVLPGTGIPQIPRLALVEHHETQLRKNGAFVQRESPATNERTQQSETYVETDVETDVTDGETDMTDVEMGATDALQTKQKTEATPARMPTNSSGSKRKRTATCDRETQTDDGEITTQDGDGPRKRLKLDMEEEPEEGEIIETV